MDGAVLFGACEMFLLQNLKRRISGSPCRRLCFRPKAGVGLCLLLLRCGEVGRREAHASPPKLACELLPARAQNKAA